MSLYRAHTGSTHACAHPGVHLLSPMMWSDNDDVVVVVVLVKMTSLTHPLSLSRANTYAPMQIYANICTHTCAHTTTRTLQRCNTSTDGRTPSVSVSPTDYGADPTGVKDSTEAIRTAIGHCLNQSQLSPNGLFPGSTSFPNQEGIRDMGAPFFSLLINPVLCVAHCHTARMLPTATPLGPRASNHSR
jgi:hypothetical protein